MANMKMVNGVVVPCTAEDEAAIVQKEAVAAIDREKYAKNEYILNRKNEYPSVQDQLLAIWNSMDKGEIPQSKEFYSAIKAVNDKYPEPV